EVVVLAHELEDGTVELVTGYADRGVRHDTREGDDGDLGGAATDVEHHTAGGRVHRQPDADRRGHRLGHHPDVLDAGAPGGVAHRAALDFGDAGGDAHDEPRLDPQEPPADHGPQEVPQHLLGHAEVRDDAVLERA